jgi:hypothetical protein
MLRSLTAGFINMIEGVDREAQPPPRRSIGLIQTLPERCARHAKSPRSFSLVST